MRQQHFEQLPFFVVIQKNSMVKNGDVLNCIWKMRFKRSSLGIFHHLEKKLKSDVLCLNAYLL